MSVRMAPCDWPVAYPADCDCTSLESLAPSGVAMVEEMATAYLWRWTGRQLGLCETTIRPCKIECTEGQSTYWGGGPFQGGSPWRPVIIGGLWYNLGCGLCGENCSCTAISSIRLPGIVDSISSVVIDGDVLAPGAYRVDDAKHLVRVDGSTWPACQDMGSPSASGVGDAGTWEVTYKFGAPVPVGGQVAAGVLACELAKALCGEQCGLPQRVQTITRQGVTVAMLDSFDDIDTGHTGIWLIDSWVASMMEPPVQSRVYSPDVPRPRRTTWP